MARKTLTDRGVAALRARASRYFYADPELTGHYVRVSESGVKVFYAAARGGPAGKQTWVQIGPADTIKIDDAREQARGVLKRLREGLTAQEQAPETYRSVAENYLKRHVRANALISGDEVERVLNVYVLPVWGELPFADIRRSDIAKLLDAIEDKHGKATADVVLRTTRGVANWYAARSDDYASPFTRGMRRTSPQARTRARILTDDEIRVLWKAAEANGTFGAFLLIALLTAQRKDKVVTMKWSDVSPDGVWTIAAAEREKGTAGELVLPPVAVDVIRARPRIGDNPFVFPGRGDGPFNGFSKGKATFDRKLPPDMPAWVIHDLRRSARSLMARAGVRPDVAEKVMGHAIAGVEGVYDRHSYRDEKADALQRLATLIDGIVHPRKNVLPLAKRR